MESIDYDHEAIIQEVAKDVIDHLCETIVCDDGQQKIDVIRDVMIEVMAGISLTYCVIYPAVDPTLAMKAIIQEVSEKFYTRINAKKLCSN